MITNHLVSYAQNREDILLRAFFDPKEVGFYVDVGAYDPDDDSVTRLFYDRGWRGINIEPQPNRFKLFVAKRPEDININKGISNKSGKFILRSYSNQGLSTFSEEIQEDYTQKSGDQNTSTYKDIEVEVTTLKDLFTEYKVSKIQFLKVDVEGLEYEVLDGNNWDKFRPEVICIEITNIKHDWRSFLKSKQYTKVFTDGINDYYTDDKTDKATKFDYVESVVFKEPIVNHKLLTDFSRYEENIDWLEATAESLRAENEELSNQLAEVHTVLAEVLPLKRHFKRQVRHHLAGIDRKILSKFSKEDTFQPVGNAPTSANGLEAAAEYDKKNFDEFNKQGKTHALLPAYKKTRGVAISQTRKIARKFKAGS
jgi:FkbM family methyltransferase